MWHRMTRLDDNAEIQSEEKLSSRPRRLRYLALGILLGSAVALVGVLLFLVSTRERLDPPITMDGLDSAVDRWSEHGPTDYDLDLELLGANTATVHVEVRHGEVVQVIYNGRKLESRLWDDWSVPGLFSIIRIDIESCMAKQTHSQKGAAPVDVEPRGLFDDRYGYPLRYRRVTSSGADARWLVTRFKLR
jgi:hypothetical protein